MPGLNTTGAPNTRDYNLGRGIVYFAKKDVTTGLPDASGFRDLGNAPEFTITVNTEDLRHQSSREQIKFTDARCTISQEVALAFQLDEMNFQNLALFFFGETATYDNPHDTTFATTAATVSSAVVLGRWYELRNGSGARVYNLDAAGTVYTLEEDPAGTPTTLVEGTDYEIDEKMGMVRFLPTATNVAAGETVGFGITTGATTAQDLDEVAAATQGDVVGVLKFVGSNACDQGQLSEYQFHSVSLASENDLSLISDEITTANFAGVAERNALVPDKSKVLTIRTYDQLA